jgi:hypothetical protein
MDIGLQEFCYFAKLAARSFLAAESSLFVGIFSDGQ